MLMTSHRDSMYSVKSFHCSPLGEMKFLVRVEVKAEIGKQPVIWHLNFNRSGDLGCIYMSTVQCSVDLKSQNSFFS